MYYSFGGFSLSCFSIVELINRNPGGKPLDIKDLINLALQTEKLWEIKGSYVESIAESEIPESQWEPCRKLLEEARAPRRLWIAFMAGCARGISVFDQDAIEKFYRFMVQVDTAIDFERKTTSIDARITHILLGKIPIIDGATPENLEETARRFKGYPLGVLVQRAIEPLKQQLSKPEWEQPGYMDMGD